MPFIPPFTAIPVPEAGGRLSQGFLIIDSAQFAIARVADEEARDFILAALAPVELPDPQTPPLCPQHDWKIVRVAGSTPEYSTAYWACFECGSTMPFATDF